MTPDNIDNISILSTVIVGMIILAAALSYGCSEYSKTQQEAIKAGLHQEWDSNAREKVWVK